jgi:hypothetical protein
VTINSDIPVDELKKYREIFGFELSGFLFLSGLAERMANLKNRPGEATIVSNFYQRDAIRHFTWMYSTASNYGVDKAQQAGDAHERFSGKADELFALYKNGTGQDISYLRDPNYILIAVLTRTKYNIPFSEKRKYNESLFN